MSPEGPGHGKQVGDSLGLPIGYVESVIIDLTGWSYLWIIQFIAVRKTLEANMHMTDLFPPGRVLWALRDSDLHPSHRLSTPQTHHQEKSLKSSTKTEEIEGKDKLRLFEVLDVEKVFSQIVFAKDMLRYCILLLS